jgi:hypothetical protein
MRKWFKYAAVVLVLGLLFAFLNRERFESSEPPKRPAKVLVPYGNVLFTEEDDTQNSSSNFSSLAPIARE